MNCQRCDRPIVPTDNALFYKRVTINGETIICLCPVCTVNLLTIIIDSGNGWLFRAIYNYSYHNNTELIYEFFIPELRKS